MSSEPIDPCTDIQPQLAAYALGEAEAAAELLDHLAACPACQRDLSAYVQVARILPYDAPDTEPPPALRERILAAVEQEAAAPAPPDLGMPTIADAVRRPARPRWRLPSFRPALALALAAVVALLGWNIALQSQLSAQTAQISANRESWRIMTALLNDPDVHWYALSGDTATGHLWVTPQGQVGCLVVQALPPIASDQVYQVWLTRAGERVSGGVFEARNGSGWMLVRADEALSGYDALGVTVEPRGGSPAPTSPPVLRGTIAASQASRLD